MKLGPFLRQPTSIAGLAGTIATSIALATGAMDVKQATAALTGALTLILIPEKKD